MVKEALAKGKHRRSPLDPANISPLAVPQDSTAFRMPYIGSLSESSSLTFLASPTHTPPASLKSVIQFKFLALPLVVTWASYVAPKGLSLPTCNVQMGIITGF